MLEKFIIRNIAKNYQEKTTTSYSFEDDNIRNLQFVYDNLSNLRQRYDRKLRVFQGFGYDRLNRVKETFIETKYESFRTFYAYDELGNIRYKSDIGEYEYNYSKPHQVLRTGNKTFEYDENGNMINNNGLNIEYTSYNKVKKLETKNGNVYFYYNPDKIRYKKESRDYRTHYLGKSFEASTFRDGHSEFKYFIYVKGKVVSIYTNSTQDNSSSTKYLHYDSLNSVDTITNNLGVVEERMVYKAFGEKLNLDKYGNLSSEPSFTNRGYTGHEHIEESHLIHMNGRVYDPIIARFTSADPNIFHPFNTQNFNRYSYVMNNPLKYIDPSGYGVLSSEHTGNPKDTGGYSGGYGSSGNKSYKEISSGSSGDSDGDSNINQKVQTKKKEQIINKNEITEFDLKLLKIKSKEVILNESIRLMKKEKNKISVVSIELSKDIDIKIGNLNNPHINIKRDNNSFTSNSVIILYLFYVHYIQ